jgi:ABC-type lipoprotein export system ATPase subunit
MVRDNTVTQPDAESKTVSCNNLRFSYGKELVFDSFSYDFGAGITLIKGYSGCGKSTLLKLIAGYLSPKRGSVKLPLPWKKPTKKFQREGLGFVFQQLNLLPLANLSSNLNLVASLAGMSGRATRERRDFLFGRLGLSELKSKKPSNLSGGQQQRAAVARALMKNPPILLLDEPTSGLDDTNTEVIKNILSHELSEECTCIVSSHDQRLEEIADEIVDFNRRLPVERHFEEMV